MPWITLHIAYADLPLHLNTDQLVTIMEWPSEGSAGEAQAKVTCTDGACYFVRETLAQIQELLERVVYRSSAPHTEEPS